MRSLITALVIFVAIVVEITASSFYVRNNTEELSASIDYIIQALYEENWESAEKAFKKTEDMLERDAEIFEAIYDHEEIDQLKTPQIRAESYISQKNADEALAELSVLKELINHLAEKDRLMFYNLL